MKVADTYDLSASAGFCGKHAMAGSSRPMTAAAGLAGCDDDMFELFAQVPRRAKRATSKTYDGSERDTSDDGESGGDDAGAESG